ncbi:hypothetical protein VTL71DRAFT_12435 [Oculimacula yallundae]|uniref:Jacalin-type lectin domain-containing protein n=1 Tax=Oculimacula yallundae TaxID=86028 RepID=A0ABR4CN18_9HELO
MSYPKNAWVDNTPVGGVGGANFEIVSPVGALVKSLRVFHRIDKNKKTWLRGLDVTFSNGTHGKTGTCDDGSSFEEFIFHSGAKPHKIGGMSLWGMGTAKWDQVRKMEFYTEDNMKFGIGDTKGCPQAYRMDVGSGILIGFKGASGGEIDSLAPIFLKPLKKLSISKVEYPKLDLENTDFMEMQTLDKATARYNGVPWTFSLDKTRSVILTTTWNQKFTVELGTEIVFEQNLLVADFQEKLSLKIGGQLDRGGSEAKTELVTSKFTALIKSKEDEVEATVTYWSGTLDLDYTGVLNFVLQDGQTFSVPTEGSLSQVVCTKSILTLMPLNPLPNEENRELEEGDTGGEYTEAQTENEERSPEDGAEEEQACGTIDEEQPQVDEDGEPLATEPGTNYNENGSWAGDESKSVRDINGGPMESESYGNEESEEIPQEEASDEQAFEGAPEEDMQEEDPIESESYGNEEFEEIPQEEASDEQVFEAAPEEDMQEENYGENVEEEVQDYAQEENQAEESADAPDYTAISEETTTEDYSEDSPQELYRREYPEEDQA